MSRTEKGFLILAQNLPGIDYIQQARVLARSIHRSQSEPIGVSVVVDEPTPRGVEFDEVILLPEDDARDAAWKVHNKWRLWELSPYEMTLWLDADMVMPVDISWWWPRLRQTPIRFCSRPVDFTGELIHREGYRQAWTRSRLPMVYTGLVYFDRSAEARCIFETARIVFRHWQALSKRFDIRHEVSGDLAFSLAIELLRAHEYVPEIDDFFKFVHMKPKAFAADRHLDPDWSRSLSLAAAEDLRIEGQVQRYPVHYVEKSLVEYFGRCY